MTRQLWSSRTLPIRFAIGSPEGNYFGRVFAVEPGGYDLQIAQDGGFKTIEVLDSQLNNPTRTELSLTPGQKFWRVHSMQGDSSPTTAAVTAWSATGTFSLTVAPQGQQTQTATVTLTASGRSGERVTSSPGGLSVAVGSTGSASFATGTSITLTVSNGRDAIWSGACSSSGAKRKSCTLTLTANASVAANVQ
jgi:hypothetical protein